MTMPTEERRKNDVDWKASVEQKLEDGTVEFTKLRNGQAEAIKRFNGQDITLSNIEKKLDTHVLATKDIIPILEMMAPGMKVLAALAWLATKIMRGLKFMAPIALAALAVWAALKSPFKP